MAPVIATPASVSASGNVPPTTAPTSSLAPAAAANRHVIPFVPAPVHASTPAISNTPSLGGALVPSSVDTSSYVPSDSTITTWDEIHMPLNSTSTSISTAVEHPRQGLAASIVPSDRLQGRKATNNDSGLAQNLSDIPLMRAVVIVDGKPLQTEHSSQHIPTSFPPNPKNGSIHPQGMQANTDSTLIRDYMRLKEMTTLQKEVETLMQLKIARQQSELERLHREMAVLRQHISAEDV